MDLSDTQRRAYADSHAWFPGVHESTAHEVEHFIVGLIGELGEVCEILPRRGTGLDRIIHGMARLGIEANKLKKLNRAAPFLPGSDLSVDSVGSVVSAVVDGLTDAPGASWSYGVDPSTGAELADCAIYLMDLAAALGVDLADAIETKRAVLIERWGEPAKPTAPSRHRFRLDRYPTVEADG